MMGMSGMMWMFLMPSGMACVMRMVGMLGVVSVMRVVMGMVLAMRFTSWSTEVDCPGGTSWWFPMTAFLTLNVGKSKTTTWISLGGIRHGHITWRVSFSL